MKRILVILTSIFAFAIANAQIDAINFINYGNKDGLSSSSVTSIIKDKNGYMWFGTEDGLNRFDGVKFKAYKYDTNDSTSIGANAIKVLHQDRFGNLWIGTKKTLALYDPKRDAFVNYDFTKYSSIRALYTDHLGNVWVGGYGGVFKFNPRTGEKKHYTKTGDISQLQSNTILSIFEDHKKRLWVGTNSGLHLYKKNIDGFECFQHSENVPSSISDNIIRTINEDLDGSLWIGTNNGLNKLQQDGKTFEKFKNNPTDINTLSSNCIYTIAIDKVGKLWTGTEEGLNIFEPRSGRVLRLKNDPRNKYSLTGKSVKSILIDKEGLYWIGTAQGGVNKYDDNLAFFNHVQSNFFDSHGLSSSIVTSFVEDVAGDIYIGTDGGGLNLYYRKTGLFRHIPLIPQKGKKDLSILAMEKVGDELWIGTYQEGLFVLNLVSGVVKHYLKGVGPNSISGNEIFCLKKDSKGNVWIGTNGDGVSFYNSKTGKFHQFDKTNPSEGSKISLNGFMRAIEEDKFGNIWIGSNGAGVVVYNPAFESFEVLNSGNSNLASNEVTSILADKRGQIWVGTPGSGLSLFDYATRKFVSYAEEEGLPNAVIHKILEDESGKIWVSTNKGVSCFDRESRQFKNYSYYNGLQRTNFILGSGAKTSSGELFFGGLDGFNYFNPQALKINKNIPSVQFTALKVSNQSVIPGKDAVIKEDIAVAGEIRLDHKQNFSIDFVALNYTEPLSSRYSYKLDGFDKDWNNVGTSQTAVYTNLDPGEYTFRLKAVSADGLWTTPEKTIHIQVMPPFWRTGYAYALYLILVVLIFMALRYQAVRKVKNRFALEQEKLRVKQVIEQERKEAERKHEFDQSKIKFLTNLSHEFRTPISLITGPVEKLLEQEANEQKVKQLTMVKRNAGRLLNLVNQLLDFRKLEENELKLNLTEGDIVLFIKEVAELFKDISERKLINFHFKSSLSHYDTRFDKDKIERIFFNLLSNAFKFTEQGGEVSLFINRHEDSQLKIVVADTGVGMTPDEQGRVFERFYQAEVKTSVINQGSGIGLSITKEFVKLHGGTIDIESIPGKGSVFTILLACEPVSRPLEIDLPIPMMETSQEQNNHPQEVAGPEKLTVLLVEDNEDFRSYLKDNLKSHYKIVEASNGKEGWQKALSAHPHVIVSDISMPQMDGITLCRKIKSDKRTNHIPIILLTALTGNSNQIKGLQTGANDYLTKPFSFEVLNIKIKNLVDLNESLKNTYTRQLKVALPQVEPQSDDEKLLLTITNYIEQNIDSPNLSVEDISKHVFMNRRTLYNKIVTLTGETPVEFIRSIKLDKAAALLENTDMRISEVGYAVGFSTGNYFTRAFKAKFNLSPSEYLALKKGRVI